MTKFDEYVACREEERERQRCAEWNGMLENSLRLRTREEVVTELFHSLVIPLGISSLAEGSIGGNGHIKSAERLVF